MKMSDSETCLASVAHSVDENILDDTPTCCEHQGKFHTKTGLLPRGSLGLSKFCVRLHFLPADDWASTSMCS